MTERSFVPCGSISSGSTQHLNLEEMLGKGGQAFQKDVDENDKQKGRGQGDRSQSIELEARFRSITGIARLREPRSSPFRRTFVSDIA